MRAAILLILVLVACQRPVGGHAGGGVAGAAGPSIAGTGGTEGTPMAPIAGSGAVDASTLPLFDASSAANDAAVGIGDASVDTGPAVDAGLQGDDASAAPSTVEVMASGTCEPGQAAGSLVNLVCFSESELASFGCVVGARRAGSVLSTLASVPEMESTQFAINYTEVAAGQATAYLCTGTAPSQVGWHCGNVLLGSCTNTADQATCGTAHVISPVPLYETTCSQ